MGRQHALHEVPLLRDDDLGDEQLHKHAPLLERRVSHALAQVRAHQTDGGHGLNRAGDALPLGQERAPARGERVLLIGELGILLQDARLVHRAHEVEQGGAFRVECREVGVQTGKVGVERPDIVLVCAREVGLVL